VKKREGWGRKREDWAAPGLSPPDGSVKRGQRGAEGTGANREPTAGLGNRVEQQSWALSWPRDAH